MHRCSRPFIALAATVLAQAPSGFPPCAEPAYNTAVQASGCRPPIRHASATMLASCPHSNLLSLPLVVGRTWTLLLPLTGTTVVHRQLLVLPQVAHLNLLPLLRLHRPMVPAVTRHHQLQRLRPVVQTRATHMRHHQRIWQLSKLRLPILVPVTRQQQQRPPTHRRTQTCPAASPAQTHQQRREALWRPTPVRLPPRLYWFRQ